MTMSTIKPPSKNLAKYPWSIEANTFVRKARIDLKQLKQPIYKSVVDRAINRIKFAVDNQIEDLETDPTSELLSFPLAIAFVAELNDNQLTHRFATAESKRSGDLLQLEDETLLLHLGQTTFQWNVKKIREKKGIGLRGSVLKYAVSLRDFLEISPSFHAPEWKLINQVLERGDVQISKQKFARLLEECVKVKLLRAKVQKSKVAEEFPDSFEHLKKFWGMYQSKYRPDDFGKATPDAFPPCINHIFDEVKKGVGVAHVARFTLASFLLNLNWDTTEIIDLFGSAPDFRRDFAKYQVEHIAGEGHGTKYTPPGCDYLVTNQLCYADEYCKRWRVKHPLTYYRKKAYRLGLDRKRGTPKRTPKQEED